MHADKRQRASAGAPQPGGMGDEDDEVTAYASVEDTKKAILGVLKQRHAFLGRKGITDKGYRRTPKERGAMATHVRDKFGMTVEHRELQRRDLEDRMDALALHPNQFALSLGHMGAQRKRQAARGAPRPTGRSSV